MKNIRLFILSILTSISLLMSSCIKEDFDTPPINIPTITFDTTNMISIANLKAMYQGTLLKIDTNLIIWGKVVANDESGNYYKTMIIQDNTAGLELKLDKSYLYNTYHLGQRIYIKCQDLYLGEYNKLVQLGYIYNNAIGRLPETLIDKHIFLDSLPGKSIQPKVININTISTSDISRLIKLEKLTFDLPGQDYASSTASTSHTLKDVNGNSIILRTSNYANFIANKTPSESVNITAILSIYNSDYQLTIRDLNDVQIIKSFLNETFNSSAGNWVTYSVASNKNWAWYDAGANMQIAGLGADVASEDWLISPEIDLANSTSPSLSFKSWTRFEDSGITNPMTLKISENYSGSGDPASANWTDLTATFPAQNSNTWLGSGNIDLAPYKNKKVRIAFQYKSSGTSMTTSTQWQIDDVKITDTSK